MRYIGLDLGTKTLGISLSDLTHTIATPLTTLHFAEGDYDAAISMLKPIIEENEIEKIVLGLPKNMNNSLGNRALETASFKDALLEVFQIPVVLQDERLSTVEATNYMLEADISRQKRKAKVDALAANIILQTYLDKEKGR